MDDDTADDHTDDHADDQAGDTALIPLLLGGIEYASGRLVDRLAGLTDDEYLWQPVPGMWTVHEVDGRWVPDRPASLDPQPGPAPVTTIAWRLWHLGATCLAEYVDGFGPWPLAVPPTQWFGHADAAVAAFTTAAATFCDRVRALGEGGIRRPLGPAWGPFADDTWAALVVHAQDELSHHGGEIGLLRDLYPHRGARMEP